MKNKLKILLVGILFCFSANTFAQNPSTAKTILDRVSKTYSSYKTIKADFSLAVANKQDKSNFNEKGRVYLVPGTGKYKIEMPSHALISDGKTQWSVLLDLKEVQITEVNPADKSINPSNIFSFYESGYTTKKTGEAKVAGKTLHVLELNPTDKSQNVSSIQLRVNKSDNLIYDATISDKNGNKYTYTLTNIEVNKTFSAGIFGFYKHNYPGIEIVDLR